MRKDENLIHHYSIDPFVLPFCGHAICFCCLSKETGEFEKSFNCLDCKEPVDIQFIHLHSETLQNSVINNLRIQISEIYDNLKGLLRRKWILAKNQKF